MTEANLVVSHLTTLDRTVRTISDCCSEFAALIQASQEASWGQVVSVHEFRYTGLYCITVMMS
jgi:hypothetical protein